jgi:hypothetical protein
MSRRFARLGGAALQSLLRYAVRPVAIVLAMQFVSAAAREDKYDDLKVTYHFEREGGRSKITYSLPYLDKIDRGDVLPGYFGASIDAPFPKLSALISNNLGRTVLLTGAAFEVLESTPVRRPIIIVDEDWYAVNQVMIVNRGWLGVQSGELEVQGWGRFNHQANHCMENAFPYGEHRSYKIGAFDGRISIDVGDAVPDDFKGFNPAHPSAHIFDKVEGRQETAACILGRFTFLDSLGRTSVLRFHSGVSLIMPGPAAQVPATAYYDLPLECGKRGNRVTVPVSQEVKAGASDNFVFSAWTHMTCNFVLSMALETTEHMRIPAGTMEVDILVPHYDSVPRAVLTPEERRRSQSEGWVAPLLR